MTRAITLSSFTSLIPHFTVSLCNEASVALNSVFAFSKFLVHGAALKTCKLSNCCLDIIFFNLLPILFLGKVRVLFSTELLVLITKLYNVNAVNSTKLLAMIINVSSEI